jgi:hypothetical protein
MKLQNLFESPMLPQKTFNAITRALKDTKADLNKHFQVEQIKVERKGEITSSQNTASFESRIKFPAAGKKGSPFSAKKDLTDLAHTEISNIVKSHLKKEGIKAEELSQVGRAARSGEAVFSIDEEGAGWIAIFVQYRIPN